MVMYIYGAIGAGIENSPRRISTFIASTRSTSPGQEHSNLFSRLACLVVRYVAVSWYRGLIHSTPRLHQFSVKITKIFLVSSVVSMGVVLLKKDLEFIQSQL